MAILGRSLLYYAYTLRHEYGHTIGLTDEYQGRKAKGPGRVTYKRADGTAINVRIPQRGGIMAVAVDFTFYDRFFYSVEIETQKLLWAEPGRENITCEVI